MSAAAQAQSISFDPRITASQFRTFSALTSQAIFATPIEPARGRGLLRFDIGIGATAIPIDDEADYYIRSVNEDITTGGYLLVPRVIVSKGLGFVNVAASYAKVPNSDLAILGGSIDVPIIDGGILSPTLAVRGTYSVLQGVDEFDLTNYGAEVFISKGFGPVTPYAAAGLVRTDAVAHISLGPRLPGIDLAQKFNQERYTLGVRFSLVVPKLVIEASQAEERTYSAKISFGL